MRSLPRRDAGPRRNPPSCSSVGLQRGPARAGLRLSLHGRSPERAARDRAGPNADLRAQRAAALGPGALRHQRDRAARRRRRLPRRPLPPRGREPGRRPDTLRVPGVRRLPRPSGSAGTRPGRTGPLAGRPAGSRGVAARLLGGAGDDPACGTTAGNGRPDARLPPRRRRSRSAGPPPHGAKGRRAAAVDARRSVALLHAEGGGAAAGSVELPGLPPARRRRRQDRPAPGRSGPETPARVRPRADRGPVPPGAGNDHARLLRAARPARPDRLLPSPARGPVGGERAGGGDRSAGGWAVAGGCGARGGRAGADDAGFSRLRRNGLPGAVRSLPWRRRRRRRVQRAEPSDRADGPPGLGGHLPSARRRPLRRHLRRRPGLWAEPPDAGVRPVDERRGDPGPGRVRSRALRLPGTGVVARRETRKATPCS